MSFRDYPPAQPNNPVGTPNSPRNQNPYGPYSSNDFSYKLSKEEIQVLRECQRDSFYERCLPLMTALGLGAYYGVNMGYLKPNAKYGAVPKIAVGIILGFLGGKISYKEKCEEKILALPGGKLKESILGRRAGYKLNSTQDGGFNDTSLNYAMPPYISSSFIGETKSIAELDTDRPMESFDDSYRLPTGLEDNDSERLPNTPQSRSITYDELRQRNREEYDSARRMYRRGPDDYASYSGAFIPPSSPLTDVQHPVQPIQEKSEPKPPPQRKNIYGDVFEK